MAKKNDLVVLEKTYTANFNVNPTESHQTFSIVRVANAKRDGTVTAIKDIPLGPIRKLVHMAGHPRIWTLSNHQEKAQRLIDSHAGELAWKTISAVKQAIEEA